MLLSNILESYVDKDHFPHYVQAFGKFLHEIPGVLGKYNLGQLYRNDDTSKYAMSVVSAESSLKLLQSLNMFDTGDKSIFPYEYTSLKGGFGDIISKDASTNLMLVVGSASDAVINLRSSMFSDLSSNKDEFIVPSVHKIQSYKSDTKLDSFAVSRESFLMLSEVPLTLYITISLDGEKPSNTSEYYPVIPYEGNDLAMGFIKPGVPIALVPKSHYSIMVLRSRLLRACPLIRHYFTDDPNRGLVDYLPDFGYADMVNNAMHAHVDDVFTKEFGAEISSPKFYHLLLLLLYFDGIVSDIVKTIEHIHINEDHLTLESGDAVTVEFNKNVIVSYSSAFNVLASIFPASLSYALAIYAKRASQLGLHSLNDPALYDTKDTANFSIYDASFSRSVAKLLREGFVDALVSIDSFWDYDAIERFIGPLLNSSDLQLRFWWSYFASSFYDLSVDVDEDEQSKDLFKCKSLVLYYGSLLARLSGNVSIGINDSSSGSGTAMNLNGDKSSSSPQLSQPGVADVVTQDVSKMVPLEGSNLSAMANSTKTNGATNSDVILDNSSDDSKYLTDIARFISNSSTSYGGNQDIKDLMQMFESKSVDAQRDFIEILVLRGMYRGR